MVVKELKLVNGILKSVLELTRKKHLKFKLIFFKSFRSMLKHLNRVNIRGVDERNNRK